ncbi:acetyl-CoA C-acetyltransferase [Streptosporangium sp. NPDC004631]
MPEPVIVAATRSPIGRARKGSLASVRPDDLAAAVVRAVVERVPELDPAEVADVVIGCGRPEGAHGNNIARVVAVLAGLEHSPGVTVNRYCSSSLQTIRMAEHAIRAGDGDVYVAGGVECVSWYGVASFDAPDEPNPRFDTARARTARRSGGGEPAWREPEGLPDMYIGMGQTAENVRELEGITREELDGFSLRSHRRAVAAQRNGFFDREITPIELPDGTVVRTDDGPRADTTLERLADLAPVFRVGGAVTAGNSCALNDGAAAVVVMSERRASELGITPLARIVSSAVSALHPEIMGLGPVEASRSALRKAGLSIDEIDLVEINEAFAAQVIPSARRLGVADERLNAYGGAIALGHPFGMTGARIMTTMINGLSGSGGRYGLETMCVGGGQGMAMVVERLS